MRGKRETIKRKENLFFQGNEVVAIPKGHHKTGNMAAKKSAAGRAQKTRGKGKQNADRAHVDKYADKETVGGSAKSHYAAKQAVPGFVRARVTELMATGNFTIQQAEKQARKEHEQAKADAARRKKVEAAEKRRADMERERLERESRRRSLW